MTRFIYCTIVFLLGDMAALLTPEETAWGAAFIATEAFLVGYVVGYLVRSLKESHR